MQIKNRELVSKYREHRQRKAKTSKKWIIFIKIMHGLEILLKSLLLIEKVIKQFAGFF